MKIIIYCQHVLGVGHFFRTLEIARALKAFDVLLVTGGGRVNAALPDHIRHVALPGLMMDKNFSGLHSVDPRKSVEEVKSERQKQLLDLVKKENPDLFLIELYPFGRRAFRFELTPVLDCIKQTLSLKCKVVCSLRDILVEKKDRAKYENRVINALNKWFDAVLIHSDPQLIKLDSTFVWPFGQNREQRMRALKIARFAPMTLLEDQDLALEKLSQLIEENLGRQTADIHPKLNIHGAVNTMKWIREQLNN